MTPFKIKNAYARASELNIQVASGGHEAVSKFSSSKSAPLVATQGGAKSKVTKLTPQLRIGACVAERGGKRIFERRQIRGEVSKENTYCAGAQWWHAVLPSFLQANCRHRAEFRLPQ